MEKRNTEILFIEDDLDIRDDPFILEIKEIFEEVLFFDTPNVAIEYLKNNISKKIIVMLDLAFPANQPNGHRIIEEIRSFSYLIPVIIFSGRPEDSEPFADLINNKAFAFIKKDSPSQEVIEKLLEADNYQNSSIASALEDWINFQPSEVTEVPFIQTVTGDSLTLKEILKHIRQETEIGRTFSKNILKLTIDLLSRNKESFHA